MKNQFLLLLILLAGLSYTNGAIAQKADCNASGESRYNIDGELKAERIDLGDLQYDILSRIDLYNLVNAMEMQNKTKESFLATLISFNGDKVVLINTDAGIQSRKKISYPQLRFKIVIDKTEGAFIESDDFSKVSIDELIDYLK